MKTSKVSEVNEVKEWGDGDRKTFYHNLTMDNGDKINIGKKTQLTVGAELNYEITDTSGQHEFSKAKSVNPEFTGSNNGSKKSGWTPKTIDDYKTECLVKNPSFALSYAKDFVTDLNIQKENPGEVAETTCLIADVFLEWLNSKTKEASNN